MCLQVFAVILEMRTFHQENGKRHGINCRIVLSIKFHNKSWAAFGYQMIFRWSPGGHLLCRGQPKNLLVAEGSPGSAVEFNA